MYKSQGFSLIELMVATAIVGIITLLAIPSFLEYLQKSEITAAGASAKSKTIKVVGCIQLGVNCAQARDEIRNDVNFHDTLADGDLAENTAITLEFSNSTCTVQVAYFASGTLDLINTFIRSTDTADTALNADCKRWNPTFP